MQRMDLELTDVFLEDPKAKLYLIKKLSSSKNVSYSRRELQRYFFNYYYLSMK